MGIDMAKPRFFWVVEHPERGQVQSAYHIVVSSDAKASSGDVWDSGKVASSKSAQVAFAGKALESGKSYFWKVRAWDRDGRESAWSAVARFDTGLLTKSDWKGAWIGRKNQLRKEFSLKGRAKRARAYIAGQGYYELRVNGRKAGNHVLDPAWTTYDKRVLYAAYDVTPFVREGANAVAVTLGNVVQVAGPSSPTQHRARGRDRLERRQRRVLEGRRRPHLRGQRLQRGILRCPPGDSRLGAPRVRRQRLARSRGRQKPGRGAFGATHAGHPGH
jgi:hypothetical protein